MITFLNCLSNYTFFVIGKIPLQKVGKKREQWCQTRIQCLTEYSPLAGLPFPKGGGGGGEDKRGGGQREYKNNYEHWVSECVLKKQKTEFCLTRILLIEYYLLT